MANYRRNFVPGGTYFFTVNLADRSKTLLTDQIERLGNAIRHVKERHSFTADAIVVLPEHLHTIWTLPEGDLDYPLRWRLIKTMFSRGAHIGELISLSRAEKGERGIWQRRYWEHTIQDEADYARHVDYIHFNPVKHGYVSRAIDWPHSSFHRFVKAKILPGDWAGTNSNDKSNFGESTA